MARREHYNPLLKSYPDSGKINAVSIGAETLYTRLIAASDDAGRYYGDAKWVLAKLYTARFVAGQVSEKVVEGWISELTSVGLADRYSVDGVQVLELVGVYKTLRTDVKPQVVFPARLPENVTDTGRTRAVHGTDSGRTRDENGPLDPHQTHTRPTPDQTQGEPPATKRFERPTLEEVQAYCRERGNRVDPQKWFDHYESNGWKVGPNPMKDWRAAVRNWERGDVPRHRVGARNYTTPLIKDCEEA